MVGTKQTTLTPLPLRTRLKRCASFMIGIALVMGILGATVYLSLFWTLPMYAMRRFEWHEGGLFDADLFVQFASDGPIAAGNDLYPASATLWILSVNKVPSGEPRVVVWGDQNASGEFRFQLPSMQASDEYLYVSRASPGKAGGTITPTVSGVVGFRAHLNVSLDGEFWQGWTQYASSPTDPLDITIETSPSSTYYTFLGLKATAITILIASAVGVFPAVEAAMSVFDRGRIR